MQVVIFSEARENSKAVLNREVAGAEVTLISRRHNRDAVAMSVGPCNSRMDTVHLPHSPANAAHLQRSLEQADRGPLPDQLLIDADPIDAASCEASTS